MKHKGFTIIELIVIIVIIGILTMFSIPAFRGLYKKGRLEQTRNEVVAFYQRANRYAANDGVNYILEVDVIDDSLRCMKEGLATVKDRMGMGSELDISDSTGAAITFTIQADGFVKDNSSLRVFEIYDNETKKTLEFYISPLGVMEVNKK